MVLIDYGNENDKITLRDILLYLAILFLILLMMYIYDLIRGYIKKMSLRPREIREEELGIVEGSKE